MAHPDLPPATPENLFPPNRDHDYFAERFVHHRDVVTRVPPFGRYETGEQRYGKYVHVGAVKYIDADGRLRDGMHGLDSLGGLAEDLVDAVFNADGRARLGSLYTLPREPFDDHAPLYYALRARKIYLDSR